MTGLHSINTAANFEAQLVNSMPRLRKLAFSLTTSNTDSDDLVQQTLQRAIERQGQCKDKNDIQTWLNSILRSIWKNEIRSRQVRRGNGTIDAFELQANNVDAHPEKAVVRDQLRKRVYALPDDYRSVLILVDYFGLSYSEAATMLEIKTGTVMSRLARARNKLMLGHD